jgi:hypothetical protein
MFIGPLVGLALILSVLAVTFLPQMSISNLDDVASILNLCLVFIIYGLVVAYTVGSLPALVTGIASRTGKNKFLETVYAIIIGGFSTSFTGLLLNPEPQFILAGGLLGCLSGLVCIIFQRKRDAKKMDS